MATTLNHTDLNMTVRRALPYSFQVPLNGKMCIKKLNGQTLIVSRTDVDNILKRDDLDVHRRRMYEAAIEEWNKAKVQ